MILPDNWIKQALQDGTITGGHADLVTKGVLSHGVSSYGYDVTLAPELKVMERRQRMFSGMFYEVDPKNMPNKLWRSMKVKSWINIPPYSFALGYSKEYFKMPSNVTGIVFPKSTYARCGLLCMQTVLEAGWQGQITLEFANLTPNSIKLYVNEGCAQVLFFQGDQCDCTYADRSGKYQGQTGITLPKVD